MGDGHGGGGGGRETQKVVDYRGPSKDTLINQGLT